MKLTTKQYLNGIRNSSLSGRQLEVLQILYSFPGSRATARELAKKLSPSAAPIVGAGAIGKMGKVLAKYLNIIPETYLDGGFKKPAYFSIIALYTENGYEMWGNLKRALEELGQVDKSNGGDQIIQRLPTETLNFDESILYKEGKVAQVFVDKYERNQKARLKCISHFGDTCYVCGFDFGAFYGSFAKGFIHVHHKNQLSEIKKEYQLNPIEDLIPVCANCHSVIHLTKPPMTVQEIKSKMKSRKKVVKKIFSGQ